MKIVLVGDTQVGKTCLIRRLANGVFSEHNIATIGAAFQNHVIQTKSGTVSLQIWDTAGQEKFRALAPMYYRSAAVAILCFDLTNKRTFQALEQWSMELNEKAADTLQIIICGNKKDMVEQREISFEEGTEFAKAQGAVFYAETSAKTGEGVMELFTRIAEMGELEIGPIITTQPVVKISKTIGKSNSKKSCC